MHSAAWLALLLMLPLGLTPSASATTSFSWGAQLPQWSSYSDITRPAAIAAAVGSGMTLMGTDAKDAGRIGWATTAYPTVMPFAPGDGAVERVLRDAHANGLQVVARFDVFQDLTAAAALPSTVIGGSPAWVDPACTSVRSFVLAELKDFLAHDAPDELTLDHVRYPEPADVSATAPLPCTGGTLGTVTTDRTAVITSFVQDAVNLAHSMRPGMRVSASIFAPAMTTPLGYIGQDATRLAPLVDVLRPMEYPSYLGAESTPYARVYSDTVAGVRAFGSAKVQPWVQAFGAYSTTPDIVCQEIKAVVDGGGSGAMVWWFWSAGTTLAYWQAVAACVPTGVTPTPAPAPAPTNSTFTASFSTRARGMISVTVTGNQTIASVCASVNAGTCAPLTASGDVWGSAQQPARWSHVQFVARNATGASVTSRNFTWK